MSSWKNSQGSGTRSDYRAKVSAWSQNNTSLTSRINFASLGEISVSDGIVQRLPCLDFQVICWSVFPSSSDGTCFRHIQKRLDAVREEAQSICHPRVTAAGLRRVPGGITKQQDPALCGSAQTASSAFIITFSKYPLNPDRRNFQIGQARIELRNDRGFPGSKRRNSTRFKVSPITPFSV